MQNNRISEVIRFIIDYAKENDELPSIPKIKKNIKVSSQTIYKTINDLLNYASYSSLKEDFFNGEIAIEDLEEIMKNFEDVENEASLDGEIIEDILERITDVAKKKEFKRGSIEVLDEIGIREDSKAIIKDLKGTENFEFNPDIRIGFITDIHLGFHDQQALELALSYLKHKNINILINGGDTLDLPTVSKYRTNTKLTVADEIAMGREFVRELRQFFPNVKMYWLNSNHEARLENYLLDKAKEISDLDELKIENLLRLHEYDIDFVDNKKLLTEKKEPFGIGNLYFLHGDEIRIGYKNPASKMLAKVMGNVMFGHFHFIEETYYRKIDGDLLGAWSVGCLADLSKVHYAPFNQMMNGFAYIEMDSKTGRFIVHNKKIFNGFIY